MAEAAGAVMQDKKGRMVYISVMNNLSVDCDCDSNSAALDHADPNGRDLIKRMESRNGTLILEHAEKYC